MPIIPGYNWPGGVYPNVQPFTYHDGWTYQTKLDELQKYINRVIVPYVNEETGGLAEQFVEQVNILITAVNEAMAANQDEVDQKVADLTAYVDAAVESVINDSITLQDSVMAGIVANVASATRVALNGLYAAKSLEGTVSTLAGTVGSQGTRLSTAETDIDSLETTVSGHTTNLGTLNTLVNSGRLSDAQLEAKYQLIPAQPLALFFGSSNVTPGTWVETFTTMMGWSFRNYAIAGGGFTSNPTSSFATQLANAIADVTYVDADVDYVFVADCGNDMRALATPGTFRTAVDTVMGAMRTQWPNARIIMIPALWGITADNLIQGRMMWVETLTEQLRNAGLVFDFEIVENSWLWHWDDTAWMIPSQVHYTSGGYNRVAQFLRRYMDSVEMDASIGWKNVTSKPNVNAGSVYVNREDNYIKIQGTYTLTAGLGVDVELFQTPEGIFPILDCIIPVTGPDRIPNKSIQLFGAGSSRGLARTFTAAPATGQYFISTVQPAF